MPIQPDYLERVYAGILGKLIGVYLGRPFENWTHQRIMAELGPITGYVHEQLDQPLVVTDDDVSGTFTFLRALEDHGVSADLHAQAIGKTWLNYICPNRSILWWGGNGISTEQTAWLNLKKGFPAPLSGAIATNGQTVAEQIGAQIFIDGWALVSPAQPQLAARLAEQAARVSHDGEAVHAAVLWAAMEAEAFRSHDLAHLLDTGLAAIPTDCLIAHLVADIRAWRREHADWQTCRDLIEAHYGYDKYPGNCHVVPNHAVMLMAVLYAPDDFHRAQMIVNTAGWDTDCNAGNVGCLMGIMLGLEGLGGGPDWRGPLADRMLISSADGGNGINDAVRMSYWVANLGRQLAGEPPLPASKDGAQFHFSLPGSRQGFQLAPSASAKIKGTLDSIAFEGEHALAIRFASLPPTDTLVATTPVFTPPNITRMRTYELMASPLVYPGQVVSARVIAPATNAGAVAVTLLARGYDHTDQLRDEPAPSLVLAPGDDRVLRWALPDFGGHPIAELGLALSGHDQTARGEIVLDHLRWDGCPNLTLDRPLDGGTFWQRAWVNGADLMSHSFPPPFRVSQAHGEGLVAHGTRDWADYSVSTVLTLHLGTYGGVAFGVQGLRRYYGLQLVHDQGIQLVRVRDDDTTVLAEMALPVRWEQEMAVQVDFNGNNIQAKIGENTLEADNTGQFSWACGGVGLFVYEGALSAGAMKISPLS